MKIFNKTRKTVLAENAEIAKGFWKKTIGLMFRNNMENSQGFMMEFEQEDFYGIWMFCMRFPIDLVFIDPEKRVVDFFENVKPFGINPKTWKVYKPGKPAKWVLELKSGRIKETRTSLGDKLYWH